MAKEILLCVLFTLSSLISNVVCSDSFFRKDYTYLEETDSFYKISTTRASWRISRNRCESEGATIWVPENENEVTAVVKLWNKTRSGINYTHIGISDEIFEGDFVAIDGRSIDDIYNRWADWEPNNYEGAEDCVVMASNSLMSDSSCAKLFHSICKKKSSCLDWNLLCEVPDLSYKFNNNLQKCYKFHQRPKNWNEAHTTCNAEQSYLTIINSVEERDVLMQLIDNEPKNKYKGNMTRDLIHVGFHNRHGDGWITVKGSTLDVTGYENWADQQPEHYDTPNYCGSINLSGELHDIHCDNKALFICEHDISIPNGIPIPTITTPKPAGHNIVKPSGTNLPSYYNHLCAFTVTNYKYIKEMGKCYKLHLSFKNWDDAQATCSAEQSYLAVVNSKEESDVLVKMIDAENKLRLPDGDIHIGFHNKDGNGWVTLKGTTLDVAGYNNWAAGKPQHYNEPNYCGAITFHGYLNEFSCDSTLFFICEHDIGQS